MGLEEMCVLMSRLDANKIVKRIRVPVLIQLAVCLAFLHS
jgi:hypothetical protein